MKSLLAQGGTDPQEQQQTVRLFLDCRGCDSAYFRTEIQFVNWVRDQQDSDVHLLITTPQTTGAGGRSYDLFFLGRDRFDGMTDTLKYVSGFDATSDEVRTEMVGVIKMGLMRFVGLTGVADQIVIGMTEQGPPGLEGLKRLGSKPGAMAAPEDDPWDFWVFRTSVSGYAMGESTYKNTSLSGSFTASRTTEDWKVSLGLRTSYGESRFDYGEITTLDLRRSHSFTGLLVKSLTDHFSAGLRAGVSSSTYSNNHLTLEASPVLEYNLFPYSESTRRMFTFQYALEGSYVDYVEETIYFKTEEPLLRQSLTASLDMRQPWGSASVFVGAGHHLKDIDLHNASIGGSIDVRLARGFSLRLSTSVSRIQDLISLPAGEATVEDVLLRRFRLLLTSIRTLRHLMMTIPIPPPPPSRGLTTLLKMEPNV